MVFDADEGEVDVDKRVKEAQQGVDVLLMQAHCRLIEHDDVRSCLPVAQPNRQLQPLALAAGECRERLPQSQVAQPEIQGRLQPA